MAKNSFIQVAKPGGTPNDMPKPGSKDKKVKSSKKLHVAGKKKGAGAALAGGKETGSKVKKG